MAEGPMRFGHGVGGVKAYRTTHGEQGVWPLADGSTLHVNTDTAVTVRFSSTGCSTATPVTRCRLMA